MPFEEQEKDKENAMCREDGHMMTQAETGVAAPEPQALGETSSRELSARRGDRGSTISGVKEFMDTGQI